VIDLGRELSAARDVCRGYFEEWVPARLGMSYSGALKAIQVYERFGNKGDVNFTSAIPKSVLYELAAPSTPEEVVPDVKFTSVNPGAGMSGHSAGRCKCEWPDRGYSGGRGGGR